ncbi:hypothetical protein [uncultured Enterovirga sp.]|uniref:hypothetical protein n=1 Tax=uncultured Enterovirga sp. TaxID=2026352 RepID=UPI0035CA88CA
MRSDPVPDLSHLARLAQSPKADLRPLLLRIQTQTFVSAQNRCPAAARDYEEIALGLIPLVTDDVLSETAALLGNVDDAPEAVLGALRSRLAPDMPPPAPATADRHSSAARATLADLSPSEVDDFVSLARDEVDLALAANRAVRLGGHALASLVDRARFRESLALRLLARSDLSVADRAALYGFAPTDVRAAIRGEVEGHLARTAPSRPRPGTGAGERILALAAGQRPTRLVSFLAAELRLGPGWRLDANHEASRETLVLALRALDLAPDDCVRVLLGLDWREAKSVDVIFELAAVARSTSLDAAAYLVGSDVPQRQAPVETRRSDTRELDRGRRGKAAAGRLDAANPALSAVRPARASGPSVPAGHRSKSTRGLDRI